MVEPNLFVSHRHADKEIASVLSTFVHERSNGEVEVFQSSDQRFAGLKIGKNINTELRKALGTAGVVLLVFTSEDEDWSYCMWECGVATDPTTPRTNILVVQCGKNAPKPFSDQLRINARELNDIERFVKAFLTDLDFFPGREKAIAKYSPDGPEVKKEAKKLFDDLQKVLPPLDPQPPVEWPAWPFVRIELPLGQIERIEDAADDAERVRLTREALLSPDGVVTQSARADGLFGFGFSTRQPLQRLVTEWRQRFAGTAALWFDALCEQIAKGAREVFPEIRWEPFQKVDGSAQFLPVLSQTRRLPAARRMEFDVFFYGFSAPVAQVRSRMIPATEILHKRLDGSNGKDLALADLIRELDGARRSRIPFFGPNGEPRLIVHRSMIDRFISQQVLVGKNGDEIKVLTVADLLAEPTMKEIFESTFAIVAESVSVDEAQKAMKMIEGCQDVFVTPTGDRDEPIVGWLTNVMFAT